MADEGRSFSVGAVLGRAFGTLGDNPVATFGIAFLFGAVPQALFSYLVGVAQGPFASDDMATMLFVSIGSMAVYLMLPLLVQGALVQATSAYADGDQSTWRRNLRIGLSAVLPMLGLTILLMLGIMAGFTLLLVPGVMLYVIWSAAVPALVIERKGIFAAFSRSRFLTKGARWRIFGLQILLLAIIWALLALLGLFILTSGVSTRGSGVVLSFAHQALSALTNTLVIAIWSTTQASLYISLRNWKDGPQSQDLADIFS